MRTSQRRLALQAPIYPIIPTVDGERSYFSLFVIKFVLFRYWGEQKHKDNVKKGENNMRAAIYYKQNHDGDHYTIVMRGKPKASAINGIGFQVWERIGKPKASVFDAKISQRHHFPVGDRTLGKYCTTPPENIKEMAKWFEENIERIELERHKKNWERYK